MDNVKRLVKQHKRTLLIILAFTGLGLALFVSDKTRASPGTTVIERGKEGGVQVQQELEFAVGDRPGESLTFNVAPYVREPEAAQKLLEDVVKEWDELWLGENEDSNHVWKNLNLPEAMAEGLVEISYAFDNGQCLDYDGTIRPEYLEEDGTLVEMTATFSYDDQERYETRYMVVVPPEKGSAEWISWKVKQLLKEADEHSRYDTEITLPGQLEDESISWSIETSPTWMYLIAMGLIVGIGLELKEKEEEKNRRIAREKELISEYPQMVDQLSMLFGSGMTIRRAWEKMLQTDRRRREAGAAPKLVFDEMWITYREITSGVGEAECYERFGMRIGLEPYRKLGSLLSQNLLRGSRDLQALLEREARDAMEIRKNRARKLGEEASTKLLFPMLIMLATLLLVLTVPALTSF